MTRNRELDCADIFECQHSPEVPIVDENDPTEILYWVCRCGRRHPPKPPTEERTNDTSKKEASPANHVKSEPTDRGY